MSDSQPKRISEYVPTLKTMPNNQFHGDLRGKTVADLATGDAGLPVELLKAGAARCYVVGAASADSKDDSRVIRVDGHPWDADISGVDVAFFDARTVANFDPVDGVSRLMSHLQRVMKPEGILFAILRTGQVNQFFDVPNCIVQTPDGPLPSQDFLFNGILQKYAIRMLDRFPAENAFTVTRLYRLTTKLPTLLLILGRSQSGKTSLARTLMGFDKHMHVSNDYFYAEMASMKNKSISNSLPPSIMEEIGDGSGVACGNFNRKLDQDAELFKKYLHAIAPLIPKSKSLVSMDWDLANEEHIAYAKNFFTTAGFSVWLVRRETANANPFQNEGKGLALDHEPSLKRIQLTEQSSSEEKKRVQQLSQHWWIRLGRFLKFLK